MNLKQLFCRHNEVLATRANTKSPNGKEHRRRSLYEDDRCCFVLIRCRKCGKYLQAETDEPEFFASKKETP